MRGWPVDTHEVSSKGCLDRVQLWEYLFVDTYNLNPIEGGLKSNRLPQGFSNLNWVIRRGSPRPVLGGVTPPSQKKLSNYYQYLSNFYRFLSNFYSFLSNFFIFFFQLLQILSNIQTFLFSFLVDLSNLASNNSLNMLSSLYIQGFICTIVHNE